MKTSIILGILCREYQLDSSPGKSAPDVPKLQTLPFLGEPAEESDFVLTTLIVFASINN